MLECVKRCLAQLRKQELLFPVLNFRLIEYGRTALFHKSYSSLILFPERKNGSGCDRLCSQDTSNDLSSSGSLRAKYFNISFVLGSTKDCYLKVPSKRLLAIKDLLIYEIRKVNRFWFVVACLISSPEMFNTPFPKSIPLMKLRRWCEISMKKSKITKINI